MSQQKKPEKCPYFKSNECGNPDKIHCERCNCEKYKICVSYEFLEEFKKNLKKYEEEKKDGRQEYAGEDR